MNQLHPSKQEKRDTERTGLPPDDFKEDIYCSLESFLPSGALDDHNLAVLSFHHMNLSLLLYLLWASTRQTRGKYLVFLHVGFFSVLFKIVCLLTRSVKTILMGSKSSRTHVGNGEALSKEALEELCQETGFTEDELLNWHTNFYKDCPDGKLTSKQFEHEYSKVMGKPTHKTIDYVKHMFNVYDQDKNQFIDFREFTMALSAASVVNRLRLVETLFHVFDLDSDGKITKAEIGKMLHTLVDVTESNRKHRHHQRHIHNHREDKSQKAIDLQKRVDDAFNELNANDDDHITKDEFIEWYIKSGLLADTKTDEIQVPDATRIQQLEKKTRKTRKQQLQVTKPGEEWRVPLQSNRYMSHMTETKVLHPEPNDDDDSGGREHSEVINGDRETHSKSDTDDTDSHSSKENDRWQYLFNSVLSQIRTQRLQGQKDRQNSSSLTEDHLKYFNSWKQDAEEKLKTEYLKQKSHDSLPESSPDNRSPTDVVRVRL